MKQVHRPFLIAITGGIASGKTEVCKIFQKRDFMVYFTDKIGHNILTQNKIIQELVSLFGNEIYQNGKIIRSKLGVIVFNSPSKMKILNHIVHPQIYKKIDEIIKESQEKVLIFEIPLLFENNLQKSFDLTINVVTNSKKQIRRQFLRDNISLDIAEMKIKNQMLSNEKSELANLNIENNGKISDLDSKVYKIIEKLALFPFKEVVNLKN